MGGEQPLIPAATIVRSQDVLSTRIDDELVLMSINEGLYFGLDAIGADIWDRLETPVRVSDLCAALVNDYQEDAAVIERDVLELLRRLAGRALITVTP